MFDDRPNPARPAPPPVARRRGDYAWPPEPGPSQDLWGLSDLWEVTDTHLRRPGEDLDEALGRWILFLLGNAAKAYLRFLAVILFCVALVVLVMGVMGRL